MIEVRCWRCNRKVAEAEGLTTGKVVVLCKMCKSPVVISRETVLLTNREP